MKWSGYCEPFGRVRNEPLKGSKQQACQVVGRIGRGKQMMFVEVEVGANSKGEIASIRVRQWKRLGE